MNLKGNNLIYWIFIGLLAIYILSKYFNRPEVRSFESVLVSVDTSQANQVIISPKEGGAEISLMRDGNTWVSKSGGIQSQCPPNVVQGILRELTEIKTKRLVGRSADKFDEYGVTAEAGTQVRVLRGTKLIEDFIIGRFNFNQQSRTALSYMRKTGSNDTYAVEGFIGLSFDQSFDSFRDKRILDMKTTEIAEIHLDNRETSYSLLKEGNSWTANGIAVDSASMAQYLNAVSQINGKTFHDTPYSFSGTGPSVLFKTAEKEEAVEMEEMAGETGTYLIKSSVNPDALFVSDTAGVYKSIFLDLGQLIGLDK